MVRLKIEGYNKYIPVDKKEADQLFYEFHVNLADAILESQVNDIIALEMLGNAFTKLGRHEEALKVDKQITKLLPQEPTAFYNLACSYSNLGKIDEALNALRTAVMLGYDDIEFMQNDSDLENLRKDSRFKDVLEIASNNRDADAKN